MVPRLVIVSRRLFFIPAVVRQMDACTGTWRFAAHGALAALRATAVGVWPLACLPLRPRAGRGQRMRRFPSSTRPISQVY